MSDKTEYSEKCTWPELPAPYDLALRQAVQFIFKHVPDVRGILVSGTIMRGQPSPSSDLDIYVIREKSQRQRVQRWFNGVPAEIFINPEHQVYSYLDGEKQAARPITAHMLHTGFVVFSRDDSLAQLRQHAAAVLEQAPNPSEQRLTMARYMAATRYEDATDLAKSNPETANMILGQAVYGMLHYAFLKANRYIPKDKDLLSELVNLDAEVARLAHRFYGEASIEEHFTLARALAERTIETQGFFAWESISEDVND